MALIAATWSNNVEVAPCGCACCAGGGDWTAAGACAGGGAGAVTSGLMAGMSKMDSSLMEPVRAGGGGADAATVAAGAGAEAGGGFEAAEAGVDAGCLGGLTSHALSSNPAIFFSGGGADARGVGVASTGLLTASSVFCSKAFGSTTSLVCTGGAGRPLRVLFLRAPPGPEKRPPSSPFSKLTPFLEDSPVRPYLLSRCFVTRRMSPSFTPSVRNNFSVISGIFSSPI
jgi:hypothetical protein